jgi:formylglycine-generating enzyme required for sulfatase activity
MMRQMTTIAVVGVLVWTSVLPAAEQVAKPAPAPAGMQMQELRIPDTVVKFQMIKIPAGTYALSGKQTPIKSIWVGRTEVTWDEYDAWRLCPDLKTEAAQISAIGKTRPTKLYGAADCVWGHDGYPMICITAYSGQMYCKWLSEKLGKKFRLPTEAEWEYACNAGAEPKVLDAAGLEKVAWYRDNCEVEGERITHIVASKQANAWGLYDMLGNAAEWTIGDDEPVVKGGSYKDGIKLIQSAPRRAYLPSWQFRDPQIPKSKWWLSDGHHCGFRIVMEE